MVSHCTRRAGDSPMLGRSENLGDEGGQARESVTTTPNQALERTATRRVFIFQMIKIVSVEPTPALCGGRSACSR